MTETRCDVEVVIANRKAMPRAVCINGFDIPGLEKVTVEYAVGIPRRVVLFLIPDSVVEVEPPEAKVPE